MKNVSAPSRNSRLAATLWTAAVVFLWTSAARADFIFEYAGHTYKLIETPTQWATAAASANRMTLAGEAGYLARIDSADENAAIFDAITSRLTNEQLIETTPDDGSGSAFIWLGGSDSELEGDWRWINNDESFWFGDFNGSPIGGLYNNWGVQPDDTAGTQNALAMGLGDWPEPFYDLGSAGQWNDVDPAFALFYLIEFDSVVEPIKLNVDEPANLSAQSGVGMIRGWALSGEPIDRIEVFIDGNYMFDIPYGDLRLDVAAKFPDMEGADKSGFSIPFRFSSLAAGQHLLDVVVVDDFGRRSERSAKFDVVRFEQGYVGQKDTPNMDWSYSSAVGRTISVRGVVIGDASYRVDLQWQTRSQKFEIVNIEKISQ